MGDPPKLPPLEPEADPDRLIDDGPTPVNPPPDMGPPRPPETIDRQTDREIADLRGALAEVARLRALAAAGCANCALLEERCGQLAHDLVRLRMREGELCAELELLKAELARRS